MLCTLLGGSVVCMPYKNDKLKRLAEAVCEFKVNIADLTPSVSKLLRPQDVPDLEVLRLSSEAVGNALLQR